ncbi:hypothetical protein PHMEG_0006309 [Phytophthora megakarya]|uniref:Transposase n=1 Tax=Phytophthora megakarya TaxID=4795 RepID=A0A225WPG7_9STRA|nr:hypothetical protein PHMEG_0006309 [Phytophthora megakarya]
MPKVVTMTHAHSNTVLYCLYGFYEHGLLRKELAHVFTNRETTIDNWIRVCESTGTFGRAQTSNPKKFPDDHRKWFCEYYSSNPLAYLDETQDAFQHAYNLSISKSSVWWIKHDCGLTWKVLERRAMHIKEQDDF